MFLLPNLSNHPIDHHFLAYHKTNSNKNYIDDLKELGGCEEISISGGGEPFIVKDIMKMIEHTKKLGFKLRVFTNFSRVNHDDMDNFVEWGVDKFEINISAGTEETYCKVRKLKSKDWNISF
jgi:MoaA/NifB/PqqE/SkfB family radical SAM enzyme